MFHKRTGQIAAIFLLLSISSQPTLSFASEPIAPVAVTESDASSSALALPAKDNLLSSLGDVSFDEFRRDAKDKIFETRSWIRSQEVPEGYKTAVQSLETKIDRFQDQVKPAGRSMKTSLKSKFPGKGLLHLGDRKVSVYGLLLMMAFAFVLLMMGSSAATSRTGSRH